METQLLTTPFFPPGTCPSVQSSGVSSSIWWLLSLNTLLLFYPQPAPPLCSHLLYCLHPPAFYADGIVSLAAFCWPRLFSSLLRLQTLSCSFTALPPPLRLLPGFLVHHSVPALPCARQPTYLQLERSECRVVYFSKGKWEVAHRWTVFQPGGDAWRSDSGGGLLLTGFHSAEVREEWNAPQFLGTKLNSVFAACLSEN